MLPLCLIVDLKKNRYPPTFHPSPYLPHHRVKIGPQLPQSALHVAHMQLSDLAALDLSHPANRQTYKIAGITFLNLFQVWMWREKKFADLIQTIGKFINILFCPAHVFFSSDISGFVLFSVSASCPLSSSCLITVTYGRALSLILRPNYNWW